MNEALKSRLEEVFKPLGIIAYSGCCRMGCTGAYDEDDPDFQVRERGIQFFRLHLSGMNYDQSPSLAGLHWSGGIEWLHENWAGELELIRKWCQVLGLGPDDYTVERPLNEDRAVMVAFERALSLDPEEVEMGSDEADA